VNKTLCAFHVYKDNTSILTVKGENTNNFIPTFTLHHPHLFTSPNHFCQGVKRDFFILYIFFILYTYFSLYILFPHSPPTVPYTVLTPFTLLESYTPSYRAPVQLHSIPLYHINPFHILLYTLPSISTLSIRVSSYVSGLNRKSVYSFHFNMIRSRYCILNLL
jgi:hypothetical protein